MAKKKQQTNDNTLSYALTTQQTRSTHTAQDTQAYDKIRDEDEDNNFEVYPNPVEGDLVFDFEFTVRTDSPYEIIDSQGRLVRSGHIQSGITAHTIDLSSLRTGMYIVRVELGGKHKVQRIIKQ